MNAQTMFPLILLTTVLVITLSIQASYTSGALNAITYQTSRGQEKKMRKEKTQCMLQEMCGLQIPSGAQQSITNGSRVKNSAALYQKRNVHTDTLGPPSKQF